MGMGHTSWLPQVVRQSIVPVMTMLLLAVYGQRTVNRNFDWASESTLFKAALQVLLPLCIFTSFWTENCMPVTCVPVYHRLALDTFGACRGRFVQTAPRCN